MVDVYKYVKYFKFHCMYIGTLILLINQVKYFKIIHTFCDCPMAI